VEPSSRSSTASDALNHASIIDGIRLCKAQRWRYEHNNLEDLERCLKEAKEKGARFTLVFTDGVFSMDGTIAQLDKIRALCDRYDALLGIDECHASGFMGRTGRGTHEHRGLLVNGRSKVDIITGTLGKALGGASGGFTAGPKDVIELLRQQLGQLGADLPVGADDENAWHAHSAPPISPSSSPACLKAATARSRCSRSCTALICTRMRACPLGTTGKKKPTAYTPSSSSRALKAWAFTASYTMIGMIGCSPGLIS
jgi:hypothetical protein